MNVAMVIVLVAVLAAQGVYFKLAWSLATRDERQSMALLATRFISDIEARARRGEAPDWLRYSSEAERVYELKDHRLRGLSSAALATGLGGTMVALAVHLGSDLSGGSVLDAEHLLPKMGTVLLASIFGVSNNLVITLSLLPIAEDKFVKDRAQLEGALHSAAEEHSPHETLAQTIKTELAHAFRDAITQFPDALDKLGEQVAALAGVVSAQAEGLDEALTGLAGSASAVAAATCELQPTARELAVATTKLDSMPGELRRVLDEAQVGWTTTVRTDQLAALDALRQIVLEQHEAAGRIEERRQSAVLQLDQRVADVNAAVTRLPEQLARSVESLSESVGSSWGAEARQLVFDLAETSSQHFTELRKHLDTDGNAWRNEIRHAVIDLLEKSAAHTADLREHIDAYEQSWRSRTSLVVSELLEGLSGHIDEALLEDLRVAGAALKAATEELPPEARSFATSLGEANKMLRSSVEALSASARQIEGIVSAASGFEAKLVAALETVTSDYLRTFEPFGNQIDALLQQTQLAQKQVQVSLDGQVDFIQQLLNRLAVKQEAKA